LPRRTTQGPAGLATAEANAYGFARSVPAAKDHFMPTKPRFLRGLSATFCGCLVGVAALVSAAGCVQRRMTIRSNPPGALVYVDDYQIGTTPVSTDFIYYGTRKIRLVKDGYETLTVRQPFPVPWYEIFPLDFVTENLWPWEIRDERIVDLAMTNTAAIPPETVVARAEQVRLAAGSLPAPPPAPVVRQPLAPQPIPAPPPQSLPAPQLQPPPGGGLVLPPPSPTPFQGLQPPRQNAPTQGIPGL